MQTWLAEIQTGNPPRGRPWVTLSYAQSLDGCIAARRGEPLVLSGPPAQAFTHQLRAAHDAILIGIGTLLADDPVLNVRLASGPDPQPVVLDSQLRFPLNARLLAHPTHRPWVATSRQAPARRRAALLAAGARLLFLPSQVEGRLSLPELLADLHAQGIQRLMVEGGAQVITSFLTSRLVDRLAITLAPRWLAGYPALAALDRDPIGTAVHPVLPRLSAWETERLGPDLLIWGRPEWDVEQEFGMTLPAETLRA